MLFYGFIYEINEITADEHSKMNESEEIERKKTFIFYGKSNRSILRTQTKNEYTFLLCYTVYHTNIIHHTSTRNCAQLTIFGTIIFPTESKQ